MIFVEWNFMKIFGLTISINLSTHIFCMNQLSFARFDLIFFILWLKKQVNFSKNFFLSKYHDPLKILNLHRKSNYGQNKNIARFLDQQLRALCSSFVHILIIYANLKFSIGSYWNGCYQFFYLFVSLKASFLQSFCIFVI